MTKPLDTPVDDLEMTARLRGACRFGNIKTLRDLAKTAPFDLLRISNCGRKTLRNAQEVLSLEGLRMEMTDEELDRLHLTFCDGCREYMPTTRKIWRFILCDKCESELWEAMNNDCAEQGDD